MERRASFVPDRRTFVRVAVGLLIPPLASLDSAWGQQLPQTVRLGLLRLGDRLSAERYLEALKQGLREYGYFEGKNLVLEARYADGKVDRLSPLAAELVRLKVQIIVTTDTPATLAARQA